MKIRIALALLAIAAAIVVAFNLGHDGATSNAASGNEPSAQPSVVPPPSPTSPVSETKTAPAPAAVLESQPAPVPPLPANPVVATKPQKQHKQKPAAQDPIARVALSFVGADPDAEAYWTQAINDPTLPAEERKDLIEDLNEDGLSDPHHPGPQDMPLIANRIKLIEELAPSALDQVNADAFAEAHKDLVNLYNGLPAR